MRKALSREEIQVAVEALMKADGQAQETALKSKSSLVIFLEKVGLGWLADKIADFIETAYEWLCEQIKDIWQSIIIA